jgi:hypothetical protein
VLLHEKPSTTRDVKAPTLRAARLGHVPAPPTGGTSSPKPRSHRSESRVSLQFAPGSEPWVRVSGPGGYRWVSGTMPVWELALRLTGWGD